MTEMNAFRLLDWGTTGYGMTPEPSPGPGEVLLEVKGAGLCASDLHFKHLPAGAWPATPPWTLGHENAGVVADVGPGVSQFAEGDAAVATGINSCGACRYCVRGHDNLCPRAIVGRGAGSDGGFAQYVVVPERQLIRLTTLDPRVAAPLADAGHTSYGAVAHVLERLTPDATALVIGAGGVGSYAVQYLKLLSSSQVVVADTSADRRAYATELGADAVMDSDAATAEAVRDLTGGRGADAVIDLVGNSATVQAALEASAPLGKIALVGMGDVDVKMSWGRAPATGAEVSWRMGANLAQLGDVIDLAERGLLRIDNEYFGFDQIEHAMGMLEAGTLTGRAVIEPGR